MDQDTAHAATPKTAADNKSRPPVSLAQIVDEHLAWIAAWHNAAFFVQDRGPEQRQNLAEAVRPPAAFHRWFEQTGDQLVAQQPVIDRLAITHDQLHTLARMVVLKNAPGQGISQDDYALVMARFDEFMSGLRRLERAFAVAASGLDPLTGLRSRVGLHAELEREQSRLDRGGKSFCVALCDIDHFKSVNDQHGHGAGDRVLAAVADVISRQLRSFDDAFRAGGEEFLLCFKETDLAEGYGVLERIRSALAATHIPLPEGGPVTVTASFGLAEARRGQPAEGLIENADRALYAAKRKGRNRIEIHEGAREA